MVLRGKEIFTHVLDNVLTSRTRAVWFVRVIILPVSDLANMVPPRSSSSISRCSAASFWML